VTFAQDLFLDAVYQRKGGGWLDFSDVPTVQLLSAEMAVDVAAPDRAGGRRRFTHFYFTTRSELTDDVLELVTHYRATPEA
jgi:hypothetical protein